ncbi:MAG TPA: type 1 glutamine amidotransferase [Phycisphaerales bacterium]|nr:type 1 glutamine amidotransferase [Phycisphaerales bacterium]
MAILVLQHDADAPVGRLGAVFRDLGLKLDVRRLDLAAGAAGPGVRTDLPADLDDVHGIISLGGSANLSDSPRAWWMEGEVALLAEAHRRQMPVIGVCLGAQMVAQALGGTVGPMARPEWGYGSVKLTTAGQTETVLAGVPWECPFFHAHGQEVKTVPAGATVLASSEACAVQAFRAGLRTYAFQFHFEADEEGAARIMRHVPGDGIAGPAGPAGAVTVEMATRAALRLCENLGIYLFPLERRLTA